MSATGGEKGSKLARFDLFMPDVMWELAEHYGKGAQKYDADNYTKGYDWSLSYAALQRHLNQFWAGEDIDEETGSKHVIAAAWHALTLAWFMDNRREYDNRRSVQENRDRGPWIHLDDVPGEVNMVQEVGDRTVWSRVGQDEWCYRDSDYGWLTGTDNDTPIVEYQDPGLDDEPREEKN